MVDLELSRRLPERCRLINPLFNLAESYRRVGLVMGQLLGLAIGHGGICLMLGLLLLLPE